MISFVLCFLICYFFYFVYRVIRWYEKRLSRLERIIKTIRAYTETSDLIPPGCKDILFSLMEDEYDLYK